MKKVDWLQRAVVFLTGVFFYCFLTWLSEYINEKGIKLIIFVLIITFLIEAFFSFNKWIRWTIEALLIYFSMLIVLGWNIILPQVYTWSNIIQSMKQNVNQLEIIVPYIGIVAGAWLLYLIMIEWFATKWRSLITIVVTVIIFTIIDTFTFHDLWFDIVLMICALIMLLIVDHFKVLRKKSPEGWDHLKDYPITVVSPILIFFGIVLISVAFIPKNIEPLLTDPYTAWKNYIGEEPAIKRYVEPTDKNGYDQKSQDSGYGRDDSQLGGRFEYVNYTVMTVETSDPTYYRGEIRHFYNGQGWEQPDVAFHLANLQLLPNEGNQTLNGQENTLIDRSLLETRQVTQMITIAPNALYDGNVLFGSYRMDSVEIMEYEAKLHQEDFYNAEIGSDEQLLWLPNVDELHYLNHDDRFPKQYEITSQVPVIDEDGLREAPPINKEENFWDTYLQLPESLPDRVSELANEIVADQTNPYDKAKAIEAYLKENFTYTNEPNESTAESEDFVDRFLFEVREGYCDYFSTAMVVLSRSLDMPARWVKGYTQGTKVDEYPIHYLAQRNPLGPGTYTVRNANAHSWVEIYFPGYGWIPFEPTATFNAPTIEVQEEIDPVATDEEVINVEEDNSMSMMEIVKNSLFILAGVIILIVLLFILWKSRKWLYWHLWKKYRTKTVNQKIILEVERLLNYGQRKGYKSFSNETLKETISRWVKQNMSLDSDSQELITLFEKAKYSGIKNMDEIELSNLHQNVQNLKKLMK